VNKDLYKKQRASVHATMLLHELIQ